MKLKNLIESRDTEMKICHLYWLDKLEVKSELAKGYTIEPVSGYHETNGYRAYRILMNITKPNDWIEQYAIPIWEDWKLTAQYIYWTAKKDTTSGQQMFDHLDDDEKIQALKYAWYPDTKKYIKKYFQEHPDLLKRARHSIVHSSFKEDLFV